jgi:hypothetical protein
VGGGVVAANVPAPVRIHFQAHLLSHAQFAAFDLADGNGGANLGLFLYFLTLYLSSIMARG